MGYLKDVITGKIGLQNVLLTRNFIKFSSKVNNFPDSNFIKHWVLTSLMCIFLFLEDILFEEKDIFRDDKGDILCINVFKMNVKKLDEQKACSIFKLIAGFHLTAFLHNIHAENLLKEVGLDKESFIRNIFETFEYSQSDIKMFYDNYDKFLDFPYLIFLHNEILKLFGVPKPEDSILFVNYIGGILSQQTLKIFTKELTKRIDKYNLRR